ncbi:hemerythrin domain-containing protein [Azospirillum sp. A1-3]|uniref:hemerythrin domain-containing protein n=1 Tax=Azospirillum sp. A1-3 TaxID=185874 RepID=UPI0020775158|nr:hemerythrin domain-containing protein [Azospirillum sp. A1-3]MCM8735820.1 hemerythrin domain-containing protein [Azospirillum sp. A1-3]
MKAIDIIHAEHRALGAVLQAFGFILDEVRDGRLKPDFALLEAMIEYITEVPDKLHHPKEDDVLFVVLRARIPQAGALIDKLQHDHAEGNRHIAELRDTLRRYREEGPDGFRTFEGTARAYIANSWGHVGLEERELLPLARMGLSEGEWANIDAAFEANKDPWSGPTGEFRSLFTRIVSMVPAPHGLGPSAGSDT